MESIPSQEAAAGERTHHEANINGIRLHYVEAGSGPLVILLHGFPEFWFSWRRQISALADAGFHVVAPDMRGYGMSDKPTGVESYTIEKLVDDVAELIHHLGAERATVVGHDWGGAVAWSVALQRPEVVEKLVVMNAPHPAALARELRTWSQAKKSWYILFFQIPILPEMAIRAGNWAMLQQVFQRVRPGAFSTTDINAYVQSMAQPGALTAALNYYRAAFRRLLRNRSPQVPPITAATLLIWGEKDPYLGTALTHNLDAWVPDLRMVRLPEVGHWVQNESPDRVNAAMLEFLRGS